MVRTSAIFIFLILLIISILGSGIYIGIRSGEIEKKIVNPIKSTATMFAEKAAKIPDRLQTSNPIVSTPSKKYQNDPVLIRKNQYIQTIESARMKFADGDFSQVIQKATNALDLADSNENKGIAHYWIGLGYYRQKNLTKAEEEENNALLLYPKFAAPYVTLSAISMDRGDYLTGLTLAQKAEQLDPTYAWAYNDEGIALVQLGRKAEGIEKFKKAIELSPDTYIFRDNLTRALKL